MNTDYVYEQAYSETLTLIALGETRDWARNNLLDAWPQLAPDEASNICAEALVDALKQGVEREDIDPSWF